MLFLIQIIPISLHAGITGKIIGQATDAASGEPLIGVNILVEGSVIGAAANIDGFYMILNVPPGTYNLRCSMIGYSDIVQRDVRVLTDLTTTINFSMETATLEGQEVVVFAKEPAVRLDVTSTSFKISSDQIEQLQVENLSDIVELQAGVVDGHFRGGRTGEVMYIIDGIPMNDAYSGENMFDIESDMIQEVDVISGIFNAEYGQAMSGIINIVTKEGQETFSSKVSYYSGDYISRHDDSFLYIDDVDPMAITNLQVNINGPIPFFKNKISFSLLGRRFRDDGWMYGQRIFNTTDSSYFSDDTAMQIIQFTGDDEYVPMAPSYRNSFQGKLTIKLGDRDKISYSGFYEGE